MRDDRTAERGRPASVRAVKSTNRAAYGNKSARRRRRAAGAAMLRRGVRAASVQSAQANDYALIRRRACVLRKEVDTRHSAGSSRWNTSPTLLRRCRRDEKVPAARCQRTVAALPERQRPRYVSRSHRKASAPTAFSIDVREKIGVACEVAGCRNRRYNYPIMPVIVCAALQRMRHNSRRLGNVPIRQRGGRRREPYALLITRSNLAV